MIPYNILSKPFSIDWLILETDERNMDSLFTCWQYSKKVGWHEFKSPDGDILEFYDEGTYVIKKNSPKKGVFQYRIPEKIYQFINDLQKHEIPIASKT
ncbi:MAG: hypothetical protein R6X28_13555 [Bacteroidales bacterium]